MKRLFAVVALTSVVFLAGCSGKPETEPVEPVEIETTAEPIVQEDPEPSALEGAAGPWVQDLWLYNTVVTFNNRGEEVDLVEQIFAHLETQTPESTDLGHGATFHVYGSLKPAISGPGGAARSDVEVHAGVIDFDGEQVLAVLATPNVSAESPIGLGDNVELDLTFLGSALRIGDPMMVDFGFVQGLPGVDPVGADGPELFAHRVSEERIQFFGETGADGPNIHEYHSLLGTAVDGSTRMQVSGKGKISDPAMDGLQNGAWEARHGGTSGVRKFFKTFEKGVSRSMDLISCNLGGCDETVETTSDAQECYLNCGEVRGDPHLVTFDGLRYSPQAVGEFALVSTDQLEVQMRTAPYLESREVSIMTAVAVKFGNHQVEVSIQPHGQPAWLVIDGAENYDLDAAEERLELAEGAVYFSSDRVRIETAGGDYVTVSVGYSQLGVSVSTAEGTSVTGMLGNDDGEPNNDLQSPDGTEFAVDLIETDMDAFYEDFVNSWRITDDQSHFTYQDGQGTETYTDLTFPDEYTAKGTLNPLLTNFAQKVCAGAGIVDPHVLADCVFDFTITKDMEFVQMAQRADLVQGLFTGRLVAGGEKGDGGTAPDAQDGQFAPGVGPEDGQTVADYVYTQWNWDPQGRYNVGEEFNHYCPPGGLLHSRVWGGDNGEYTSDSILCTAAVHAGKITVAKGGFVRAAMVAGRDSYSPAPTRNGVTPQDWDQPWHGGYVFN